jgi:hypothetical protein
LEVHDACIQPAIYAHLTVYLASHTTTDPALFDAAADRATAHASQWRQFLEAGYTRAGDHFFPSAMSIALEERQ